MLENRAASALSKPVAHNGPPHLVTKDFLVAHPWPYGHHFANAQTLYDQTPTLTCSGDHLWAGGRFLPSNNPCETAATCCSTGRDAANKSRVSKSRIGNTLRSMKGNVTNTFPTPRADWRIGSHTWLFISRLTGTANLLQRDGVALQRTSLSPVVKGIGGT